MKLPTRPGRRHGTRAVLDALLPILYLREVSTGDFQEAPAALLGRKAANLSPSVIGRLTAAWQDAHERWQACDLSARRYVYVGADRVYLKSARNASVSQVGIRESAQSWRELVVEVKRRGLAVAPEPAVGDGALGFWNGLEPIDPGTRHQRC